MLWRLCLPATAVYIYCTCTCRRNCRCVYTCVLLPKLAARFFLDDVVCVIVQPRIVSGRPVVKRFALSNRTVVCLSVCDIVGVLWPKGWMDQDATWYGSRTRPRRHCVRWGPGSPRGKGHSSPPPCFSAHFALARSPISAAGEHLFLDVAYSV